MFSAADLHVVTCIANPMRWESRYRIARKFIEHMKSLGVTLWVVECAYGERDHEYADIPGIHHIPVYARTLAWNKESLLNIGIRAMPKSAQYVCWADADIQITCQKDWALETIHALQIHPVVQPWSEALDLGPQGEVMMVKGTHVQRSFGWVWQEVGNVIDGWRKQRWDDSYVPYAHTGYLWAATIDWLRSVGLLLDFSGAGASDHQMAMAMVGHTDKAVHGMSTDSYKAHIQAWGERAYRVTQGHLGYVNARLDHSFHGRKGRRRYVERWDILTEHKFDPLTDLHRNEWGVLELSDNKPAFRRAMEQYMRQRNEDENTLD